MTTPIVHLTPTEQWNLAPRPYGAPYPLPVLRPDPYAQLDVWSLFLEERADKEDNSP